MRGPPRRRASIEMFENGFGMIVSWWFGPKVGGHRKKRCCRPNRRPVRDTGPRFYATLVL